MRLYKQIIKNYVCCCYPIFDPCFDKCSEKSKNSEKTLKNPKNTFFIHLYRF
jgi:hypothetical protein